MQSMTSRRKFQQHFRERLGHPSCREIFPDILRFFCEIPTTCLLHLPENVPSIPGHLWDFSEHFSDNSEHFLKLLKSEPRFFIIPSIRWWGDVLRNRIRSLHPSFRPGLEALDTFKAASDSIQEAVMVMHSEILNQQKESIDTRQQCVRTMCFTYV